MDGLLGFAADCTILVLGAEMAIRKVREWTGI